MVQNIFEPVYDQRGWLGVQCKDCVEGISVGTKPDYHTVMLVWSSPHASVEHNDWMMKKLRKLYRKYYSRVLVDNMGHFW